MLVDVYKDLRGNRYVEENKISGATIWYKDVNIMMSYVKSHYGDTIVIML